MPMAQSGSEDSVIGHVGLVLIGGAMVLLLSSFLHMPKWPLD